MATVRIFFIIINDCWITIDNYRLFDHFFYTFSGGRSFNNVCFGGHITSTSILLKCSKLLSNCLKKAKSGFQCAKNIFHIIQYGCHSAGKTDLVIRPHFFQWLSIAFLVIDSFSIPNSTFDYTTLLSQKKHKSKFPNFSFLFKNYLPWPIQWLN